MGTRAEQLYEEDFYAWTRDQAAALRRLADERWNGPLDLLHLAEEVEDLGSERQWAVESQLERVIEHLLKLEHSPSRKARRQWMISVVDARGEIERRLTATVRREVEPSLPDRFAARAGKPSCLFSITARRMPPAPCRMPARMPSMNCSPTSGGRRTGTA